MTPQKYRRIRTAADYRRAFSVREYAELGRVLAGYVNRPRAFSRSCVQHVMRGDYAPSPNMLTALEQYTADVIRKRTRGKFTGELYVNGRWKVSYKKA